MKNWLKSLITRKPVVEVAPRVEPVVMKINPMALALAKQPEAPVHDPIEAYAPPEGVIPAEQKKVAMAMDSTPYEYLNSAYCGARFKGYQHLALLSQQPEYRKIAEVIAKEMTRKWIKVVCVGDDDKSEKVQAIEEALETHKVKDLFRKAAELDGFFGRGQIYIEVKTPNGTTASEDPEELETPLIIDKAKITKGSLVGLRVIEPVWTYPGHYNSDNPLSKDYYKPTRWYVMGKTIHASRLLMFVGREVPDLLKASYNFGGLSMTQLAEAYVENWLRTRDAVSDLVHQFSISGILTEMSAVLAGGDGAELLHRGELFNKGRDNRGVMFLNKETEEFFQFNTPLTGLHELQAQSQEQMASVASIPLVKLLGITPAGLNANSDGEIRVFYDDIHSHQEKLFSAPLSKVIDVIQLDLFGEIDPEINFEFNPLYQLDELQKANIRKLDAETGLLHVESGAISADDERERIINDPDNDYYSLEANPEIDDADDPDDDTDFDDGPDTNAEEPGGIADVSLNGAQVTSMVDLASKVAMGEIPLDSAKAILRTAFQLDDAQVQAIIGGIKPGSAKGRDDE